MCGVGITLLWLARSVVHPQPLNESGKLLGERLLGGHRVLGLQAAPDLGSKLSF
jgi:hypothetical protein